MTARSVPAVLELRVPARPGVSLRAVTAQAAEAAARQGARGRLVYMGHAADCGAGTGVIVHAFEACA